jgi:hypothetical protein
MRHLPRLTQRAPRSLETRRNKFIPDASRVAIDRIAAQTKLMKVERDGVGKEPAWGRVNEAFLALIGLVPPPTAREDVELVEFALEALRLIHPERAALLGAWWRERPNQGA